MDRATTVERVDIFFSYIVNFQSERCDIPSSGNQPGCASEFPHQGAGWILLDLGEVVELDNTGSQLMAQSVRWCRDRGVEIAIAAKLGSVLSDLLSASGLLEVIGQDRVFPSLNRALVWAEDQFI